MLPRRLPGLGLLVLLALLGCIASPAFAAPTTFTGLVLDGGGEPLPAARVELRPFADTYSRSIAFLRGEIAAPTAFVATGPDGRFGLVAEEAGVWSLRIVAPGYVSMEKGPLPANGGWRTLAPVSLPRDAGSRIVVRDSRGRASEGVWVFAASAAARPGADGWQPAPRLARTQKDGSLDLARASFESFDLHLFAPQTLTFSEREGVTSRVELNLPARPDETPRRGRLRVREAAEGSPVPHVAIFLGEFAWTVGETSENGTLDLPWPAAARALPLRLLTAEGRYLETSLEGARRVGPDGGSPIAEFVLPPASNVDGKVLGKELGKDPTEGDGPSPGLVPSPAVPGALVWLSADPGLFTLADGLGRFRLPRTRGDRGAVRAVAPGYRSGTTRLGEIPGGEPLIVELEPARPAFGRVVDPEERPLEGVLVRIAAAGLLRAADPWTSLTDARGEFYFEHLPATHLDLEGLRRGFAPTRVRGIDVSLASARAVARDIDLGTVVLAPGASVAGRVLDGDGEPVSGAAIWLSTRVDHAPSALLGRKPDHEPLAETGGKGEFTITDLVPGARFHVLVRRDGYVPTVVEAVRAPSRRALEVRLEGGAAIHGRVTELAGQPVAGARIALMPAVELGGRELPLVGQQYQRAAASESDGTFRLETVVPGRYELAIEAAGFVQPEPRALSIGAEGLAEGEELLLVVERGSELRGRATVEGQRPAVGARISAGGEVAISDASGRFRLTGLAAGSTTIEASHATYNRVVREVEISDEDENRLDITFLGGVQVAGRVVDESARGVAGARVEIARADFRERHHRQEPTDEEGFFAIAELAAGTYSISAVAEGFAFTELPELHIEEQPIEDLELVLPRSSRVVGFVRGLDAEELSRVVVSAVGEGAPPLEGEVDFEGFYSVDGLGAGEWLITASVGDRRQARARLVVEAGGGELRRDLELGRGFTITGQVVSGGEPVGGARVELVGRDVAVRRGVLADHEGFFEIDDVEAGRYMLGASAARQLLVSHEPRTFTGPEEVILELEAAHFSGAVRDDQGPLGGARVELFQLLASGSGEGDQQEGSMYATSTNAAGEMSLPRLSAGRYRLRVEAEGYEASEELVEVPAGSSTRRDILLQPATGLELTVSLADGRRPTRLSLSLLDVAGRVAFARTRTVAREGQVAFPSAPAGRFRLVASAPGAATAELWVDLPADPWTLTLQPGAALRVRVPELVEAGALGEVTLTTQAGMPFVGVDFSGRPAASWELQAGVAEISGLPPGIFTVEVRSIDGRTFVSHVAAVVGEKTQVDVR